MSYWRNNLADLNVALASNVSSSKVFPISNVLSYFSAARHIDWKVEQLKRCNFWVSIRTCVYWTLLVPFEIYWYTKKYLRRRYSLGMLMHTGSLRLDLFQNSRNIAFAKIWHFLALIALKHTKKPIKYWKRPKKAIKVILKAKESKNGKILILLHIYDHLVSKMKRIQYFNVSRS